MALVTLIDGRQVANTSEEWRAECEARFVCKMRDRAREQYLESVEAKRGQAAAKALRIAAWWMLEIEHVCSLATKEARNKYVAEFEDRRGQQAAERLRDLVIRAWKARQVAA